MSGVTTKADRLKELRDLRVRIEAEIAVLEREIEADIRALQTALGGRVRRRKGEPIAHGTDRGYHGHRSEGSDPCEDCRAAHTEYEKHRTHQRRLKAVPNEESA